jgi:hypothetical protein
MIVKRYTPREIAHSYDSAFNGEGTDPPLCMYVRASDYDALAARCAELEALIVDHNSRCARDVDWAVFKIELPDADGENL